MTEPLFIDSPVNVLTGDAARVKLATTNDAAYLTEGKGVLSVPLERWQAAQAYERATWLTHGLMLTEDRNAEHAAMFDGYKALPDDLGSIVELGCGPFTNMRYILPERKHTFAVLADPLANAYRANHPNCTYKDGKLEGFGVSIVTSSIEEYRTIWMFHAIIMINVLSHCVDARKVFAWIDDHIAPDGYLVFHEPARDIDVHSHFDAGHPLSYTQSVIDEFLEGYAQVYKNGDYFIGRKK